MGSYLSGGRSMSTLQMHLTVFISRRRSGACPSKLSPQDCGEMRASSNPFSEIPSSERVAASNEGPTSSRTEHARCDRDKLRRFAWSMKSIKRITFFVHQKEQPW